YDRVHGRSDRAQHCGADSRQRADRDRDLECHLPCGHGQYGYRVRCATADASEERHLGEEGEMGSSRQDRLREVLPAQGAARDDGNDLRALCAESTGYREAESGMNTSPAPSRRYLRRGPFAAQAVLLMASGLILATSASRAETLEEAWRISTERDLTLAAASNRVAAAEAELDAARADRRPIVSASA